MKQLFVIGLILFLTGCGFQLKGSYELSSTLKRINIEPNNPYDPFQKRLRRLLTAHGVKIDTQDSNTATLAITQVAFSENVTSYGIDGQANRSNLELTVHYTLKISKQSTDYRLQVQRELLINPNRPLDTEAERDRIREDLYSDAVNQMLRQLSLVP